MPILDLPPNPPPTPPLPDDSPTPVVLRSSRYGELAEHELVKLLDTLDDDRSRSRFRESVYLSIIVYLVIGWFLLYGPRVLFHQGRIVNPADVLKARELTELSTPQDISKRLARNPPAKPPVLDSKTMKQLQAMRRATPQPPTPAPKPVPEAAQPAAPPPPPPVAAQPTPLPRMTPPPTPAPSAIPDAPHPSATTTRPNFGSGAQSAGDAIREAARNAARGGSAGGDYGSGITHAGGADVGSGLEVLSDTQGIDFDAYFRRLKREIYNTWIPLIPEEARPPLNKRGITQIRFTILPDGHIGAMHLDGSTHDTALDRAAWGSITGVGQFQALPQGFHGNLELRFTYYVNTEPQQ